MKKLLLNWLWLGLLLPTLNLWAAAGDVRLSPATTTVAFNTTFGLQMLVDSGTTFKVGAYQVKLTYDATKLQVDATTPGTNGANALTTNMYNATVPGTLRIAGVDASGKGPSPSVHLLTVNFKAIATNGSASIALTIEQLTTQGGVTIGSATPRAGVGSTITIGASAPTATTNAATGITSTSATLNGSVTSTGAIATVSFDFGTTTTYGASITATPSSVYSASAVAVTASKTGLTCGTTYHYRVKAVNSAGTGAGADKTFVTTACNYTVTPSAGTGGTVSPNTAQTVTGGNKATFTVTPNSGYTKNIAVGGTCPQGTWNGNVWTTGAIVASCTVNFSFTLIPVPVNGVCGSANGGTFSVAPTTNLCSSGTVSGFSGSGPWNWNCAGINGGTTATCSASAALPTTFTVTPSATTTPVGATGGSFEPAIAQTVNAGATTSFIVVPATNSGGYATNLVVTGNCPQGSWGGTWNNIWTTGPITFNCTVAFSFTDVHAWLAPTNQTVLPEQAFTLDVTAKSSTPVASYHFTVTYDTAKLRLDTNYLDATNLCRSGICPGTSALAYRIDPVPDGNTITLAANDSVGKGPGNDLQLLVIHFKSKLVADDPSFATEVKLTTNSLMTTSLANIGTGARGATVTVSNGLCGNADGSTSVNIVDALAIARKVVGLPPPPTVEDVLADVNEDGRVGITDALHIARYSIGFVTPPEVCKIGQPF